MTGSGKRPVTVTVMEYKTLELVTNNFGESNMLGAGGFGCVYKGKLEGDFDVAVKKLVGGNVDTIREFQVPVS